MSYSTTVLEQLLKAVPRFEFENLARQIDGPRRSDALPRWSQFIALLVGQLGQRHSLRGIETALATQQGIQYHLGSRPVSRSSLARVNEQLSASFFQQLFYRMYDCCR